MYKEVYTFFIIVYVNSLPSSNMIKTKTDSCSTIFARFPIVSCIDFTIFLLDEEIKIKNDKKNYYIFLDWYNFVLKISGMVENVKMNVDNLFLLCMF